MEERKKVECAWNLKKEGGWIEYLKHTEAAADKIESIVDAEDLSIEDCMNKIDCVNNKIKFSSFGKTRKTNGKKKSHTCKKCSECGRLVGGLEVASELECQHGQGMGRAVISSHRMEGEQIEGKSSQGVEEQKRSAGQESVPCGLAEQEDCDVIEDNCNTCHGENKKLEAILKMQAQKLEEEINDIKKTGAGRMARIFKLKQKITGSRKVGQEPSAIRDPDNGELVVSSSEIRKTTLRYCTEHLKNNKASKNVESIVKLKGPVHQLDM